ncbi:UNVERIFIED_CONTAM: hypothetical protein FKN15_036378 [Acipenser sinensis]
MPFLSLQSGCHVLGFLPKMDSSMRIAVEQGSLYLLESEKVHRDKISALKITDEVIVTGSCDCSVKLWDRVTKKQVGLFQCQGPVSCMEISPGQSAVLACGDSLGNTYFIKWRD